MSDLSSTDIDHLAKLARIALSDEEKKKLAKELPVIVDFYGDLQGLAKGELNLDTKTIELKDLRADKLGQSDSLNLEDLKKLAPRWQDNQVVVPAVFES